MNTEMINTTANPSSKGTLAAALSAIGSVLAAGDLLPTGASLCTGCRNGRNRYVPVFLHWALQPHLLGVSVLFIALGFYQSRRASQCNCKPSVLSQVVLWVSALIVAISILLPQVFADLIERLL